MAKDTADIQKIFRQDRTKEQIKSEMFEKYGEEIINKIGVIQSELKKGTNLDDACTLANVDKEGFEVLMDQDHDLRHLISLAKIEWKKEMIDKIKSGGSTANIIALLEKTTGGTDNYVDPLTAMIQHIQNNGQGSSLVSDRINKK